MRKNVFKLVTLVCCVALFMISVNAGVVAHSDEVISRERIELSDGGYIIEEITESTVQTYATSTKTGTKTSTRYTSNNVALFSVVVTGKFPYDGSTSKATYSAATVNIHNTDASYVSKSASYSGNTATATGKVSYLGSTLSQTAKLSCSASGVLS